jgi:hypothetical protein
VRLYEILIPQADNSKRAFSRAYHRAWEKLVRESAGGLSICPTIEGQWIDKGKLYRERMRPVRIACSAQKMRKLADLAKLHYRQLSVMYYPVSPDVRFV